MNTVEHNVALAPLTTFGIGGAAEFFTTAQSVEDIEAALAWASEHGAASTFLGGGSNMLVADEGVRGLVVRLALSHVAYDGTVLEAEAGAPLLTLIRDAQAHGLGGWEKMAGIPGTVGGAVRGNAGAFGVEMKDVVASVTALHRASGERRTFAAHECDFSYRHSFFKDHPEWIILSVRVILASVEHAVSDALIRTTIAERERRHLQNVRAAGSYFMNPVASPDVCAQFEKEKGVPAREGRVPAGWLIEQAGMKGARHGGAEASAQHPNYIVNRDNATAADVLALASAIKSAVFATTGVALTEEVQYVS